MVQWTDKPAPAPRPQVGPEELKAGERKPDVAAAPRPALRKARKNRMAGLLQVVTICGVFGLIVASVFMFKEMRAKPDTASAAGASAPVAGAANAAKQRDAATGRIVVMDRDHCRELDFDNQTGQTIQKGAVSCHDTLHPSAANNSLYRHPTNRLEHIRRSFAQ